MARYYFLIPIKYNPLPNNKNTMTSFERYSGFIFNPKPPVIPIKTAPKKKRADAPKNILPK